jgi:hypothetical protein
MAANRRRRNTRRINRRIRGTAHRCTVLVQVSIVVVIVTGFFRPIVTRRQVFGCASSTLSIGTCCCRIVCCATAETQIIISSFLRRRVLTRPVLVYIRKKKGRRVAMSKIRFRAMRRAEKNNNIAHIIIDHHSSENNNNNNNNIVPRYRYHPRAKTDCSSIGWRERRQS